MEYLFHCEWNIGSGRLPLPDVALLVVKTDARLEYQDAHFLSCAFMGQ
jgi:hypothetical protein